MLNFYTAFLRNLFPLNKIHLWWRSHQPEVPCMWPQHDQNAVATTANVSDAYLTKNLHVAKFWEVKVAFLLDPVYAKLELCHLCAQWIHLSTTHHHKCRYQMKENRQQQQKVWKIYKYEKSQTSNLTWILQTHIIYDSDHLITQTHRKHKHSRSMCTNCERRQSTEKYIYMPMHYPDAQES